MFLLDTYFFSTAVLETFGKVLFDRTQPQHLISIGIS
jgi:hypothetical protein